MSILIICFIFFSLFFNYNYKEGTDYYSFYFVVVEHKKRRGALRPPPGLINRTAY